MPLIRKSPIDAMSTVAELLCLLQLEGHLDHVETPPWAEGSSVAELLEALRTLGDGCWLPANEDGERPNVSAADRWVHRYLAGQPVPLPGEAD